MTNILQLSVNLKRVSYATSENSVEICRYIFINLDKGGLVPELSEPAAAKSNRNGGWSWGRFIAGARSSQHHQHHQPQPHGQHASGDLGADL